MTRRARSSSPAPGSPARAVPRRFGRRATTASSSSSARSRSALRAPGAFQGVPRRTRSAADLLLRPDSFWAEQRIELVLGERVAAVDRERKTATTSRGRVIRWDALVLATGARPRRLPFHSPSGVHVLRTLADAAALREELLPGARLAIVGGGFVGAEVASTARTLGVDVTLLEAGPAPFARARP